MSTNTSHSYQYVKTCKHNMVNGRNIKHNILSILRSQEGQCLFCP